MMHPLFQSIFAAHGAPTPQPRCHKCGGEVLVYPTDEPVRAVCPQCCPEHEYNYDSGAFGLGWNCDHCGDPPPREWYDDQDSEGLWQRSGGRK